MTKLDGTGAPDRPRTQEERSREMRARLVAAAIICIEQHGFAGASVTRIIETAGVSRGAYLHHFRAKHLIHKAVALQLVSDTFRRLGEIERDEGGPEADLRSLAHRTWTDIINGPQGRVFSELMQAARTDEILAQHLRRPAFRAIRIFGWAAARRFPVAEGSPLTSVDLVRLTQWHLRGMALDTALALDPTYFHRQIELFVDAMAPYLEPKARQ